MLFDYLYFFNIIADKKNIAEYCRHLPWWCAYGSMPMVMRCTSLKCAHGGVLQTSPR